MGKENDVVLKEKETNSKANNVLIKIQAELLKTGLIGLYSGSDKDYVLAVLPDPNTPSQEMTLDTLINEIVRVPGVQVDVDAIKKSISSVVDLNTVKLQMNELYYYNKCKAGVSDAEYAFELTLKTEDFHLSILELKSASLAIWNTTKPSELERMGIDEILSIMQEPQAAIA